MGEMVYEANKQFFRFSEENDDIGCLCTFPHNDFDEKGELIIDEWRLVALAVLGCAIALSHNTTELKNDEYVHLPKSIEKYFNAIKKCIEKLKDEKTHKAKPNS
jgi:hypothetical protein